MKALKIIGAVLLIILVILLVVAIFLPSTVYMEREASIKAPANTVFKQVNTMENWDHWSPFPEADPDMMVMYEGEKTGVGAVQSWTMDGDTGTLTIIESEPYNRIRTKLDILEGNESYGNWTFTETGDSTLVTWGVEINNLKYPLERYMGLFMPGMMNRSFDQGLHNLKIHAENLPDYPEISEGYFEEKHTLAIYDTLYFENISTQMGLIYGEIMGYLEAKNTIPAGMPFTVYYSFNPGENYTTIRAGFPVMLSTEGEGRIEAFKLGPANVIKAIHKGAYDNLSQTYEAIEEYIAEFDKEVTGAPWEVYITDPTMESDTSNWVTHVYFPVAD